MRTTYGVPGLSDRRDSFGASGDANQGSELKVLLRDSNEENRSSPEPELVDQEVVLEAPETRLALLLPDALERSEPCRAELPRRLRPNRELPYGSGSSVRPRRRRQNQSNCSTSAGVNRLMYVSRMATDGAPRRSRIASARGRGSSIRQRTRAGPRAARGTRGSRAVRRAGHQVEEHVAPVRFRDADRQLVGEVARRSSVGRSPNVSCG